MHHAVEQVTTKTTNAMHAAGSAQQVPPSSAVPRDTVSHSSTSSPKSQKVSPDPNLSQVSESTLASATAHEITPPSSVASSQEQRDASQYVENVASSKDMRAPLSAMGKKRRANGQIKDSQTAAHADTSLNGPGHVRNTSTLSQASSASLGELSQQLRTKLTYAMVKVQNGWQKHSLDEIESIASQSPCSNLSGFATREIHSVVSPRSVIAASRRQNKASTPPDHLLERKPHLTSTPTLASTLSPPRRSLAPPAPIIAGPRRRPPPNVQLQINSSLKSAHRPTRPMTNQRTPSQNAAMEADAVETLLFMSASPSTSGHFPSHLSAYSPTSQAFSAQASPLKTAFSVNDRNYASAAIDYSPRASRRRSRYEDKAALIDRLLSELDDDESEELDRAVKIMEQHHAAKLSA